MKAVLAQVAGSLEDSGRFVCRLYVPPASPETVSAIKDAVLSGGIQNFHAFKFRLGMALSAQAAASSIGVAAILIEFNRLFGDRAEIDAMARPFRFHGVSIGGARATRHRDVRGADGSL